MKTCEKCNVSMLRDHPESSRPELSGWLKCGFCGYCRLKKEEDRHGFGQKSQKHDIKSRHELYEYRRKHLN